METKIHKTEAKEKFNVKEWSEINNNRREKTSSLVSQEEDKQNHFHSQIHHWQSFGKKKKQEKTLDSAEINEKNIDEAAEN